MTAACARCGAPLPASVLEVNEVGVVLAGPADERQGLLGWGRAQVGPFVFSGLAVRLNGAGEIVVTYPARKDRSGGLHREVTTLDADLDGRIRAAVIAAYAAERTRCGRRSR